MKQIFLGTILFMALLFCSALAEKGVVEKKSIEIKTEELKEVKEVKINKYKLFMDRMAFLEGSGDPTKTSPSGSYIGKFQFGKLAFKEVGHKINIRAFKNNPRILPERVQEELFIKYCLANKHYLSMEIEKYSGKTIKGIKITKAGILAAAHLGGQKNVKKFLKSNGRKDFADGNGTKISKYMTEFQNISDDELDLEEALNEYTHKKFKIS
jgi:hypothetical protein